MICNADAIRSGLPTQNCADRPILPSLAGTQIGRVRSILPSPAGRGVGGEGSSHGCANPGMRRCDVVNPVSPAFGRAPIPVAPSSRISPPEPVAAPGNGAIAVG